MIRVHQHGPVTAFRLSRSIFGRPLYWTAAYWVDGLLIDSGPSCTANELTNSLGYREVSQIVITHAHEDHFGGLAAMHAQFSDAKLYAHRRALGGIAEPDRLQMQYFRRFFWGRPPGKTGVYSLDDIGNTITTANHQFRIIDTPGHCPSHISLFEPDERWLFSGDAFIGGQDRAWISGYDLFGVVSSLRMLASLHPESMFPGSGSVRTDPVREIEGKLDWYTELASRVAESESKGMSVSAMVDNLLGGETHMRLLTRGHFSAQNLIEACQSYNALLNTGCDTIEANKTQSSTSVTT